MNGPALMATLLEIKETATRKNRATDLKKYLINDLDKIDRKVEEAIYYLREED